MINNLKLKTLSCKGNYFPSLITGLILGTLEITFVLAFTALIFPEQLSAYFTEGLAILLFGTVVCFLMLALFSSYPGTIGSAQDIPASISAIMAVSIVAAMSNESNSYVVFSTVIAAMALASFISAVLLVLMAFTGLGKLIRFIPYPVIGGLLISTGWILSKAGLGMMPDQWLIGSCFALLLLFARHYFVSLWVLPVMLVVAIVVINLYLAVMGISIDAAREQGYLLDVELNKIPFIQAPTNIFNAADWQVVFEQSPTIISLSLITCLIVLIQISSIEVIVKQDLEPTRELYITGIANLIVAFCCGLISYHHISSTTLAYNMGAKTRAVGVITAAVCLLVFITNSRWMEFLPLPVLAGLILYLGLDFIYEWLIQSYRKVPRNEYLIMLGIFACVILINFPAAICFGIISGTALFVFQYNTVGILHSVITADNCKSSVMRTASQADYLAAHRHSICAFRLKGMLYFGTAHELYEISRQLLTTTDSRQVKYIIFDFEQIAEIDSTALMSLLRTHQYLSQRHIQLIMCSLTTRQIHKIKTFYASNDQMQSLLLTGSLDHAIEYTEEKLLTAANLLDIEQTDCLDTILENQRWTKSAIGQLKGYLQKQQLCDYQLLIRSGEYNDDIFIIASGKLEIAIKKSDGERKRLRVLTAGMVVGEMSLYTGSPRSADVMAIGDTIVYQLSATKLETLANKHPDIAIKLHTFFARILAQRFEEEPRLQLIRSI